MTLKEAETLALSTLKAVMEEKVSTVNVDMACVSPAYKVYSKEDIKAIIERL
jgi:20S proteasome subunit alpha 5